MAERPDVYVKPIRTTPDSLRINFLTLTECIAWAYQVHDFQIVGEKPSPQHYEIVAKAGRAVAVSDLRAMMRSLLAERFRLALHRVSRLMNVYALLPGKSPKLEAADGEGEMSRRVTPSGVLFDHASMFVLADLLSTENSTPVIDLTGLSGSYKFKFAAPAAMGDGLPRVRFSFLAATHDQLGLIVEKRRAAVDVLVIDHFESPPEN